MVKYFFIIYFLIISNCIANPDIQSIPDMSKISGNNFGSGPDITVWDTFENGTNGSTIGNQNAIIGDWDTSANYESVYSNTIAYSGAKSSYHQFRPGHVTVNLSKNISFSKIYIDFWYNLYSIVDNYGRGTKIWRFYGNNDSLQHNANWGQIGTGIYESTFSVYDGTGSLNAGYTNENFKPEHLNQWIHFQAWIKLGDNDVANGTIYDIRDCVTGGVASSSIKTRILSTEFNQIRIGHYWATDAQPGNEIQQPANGGADIYIDNVYISVGNNSWARIEIGNNSTYSSCTHREIQIPTSWSDTEISFTFNQGSFVTGDQAYLFVIDSDGNASEGYPITIPGTSLNTTGTLEYSGSLTME